VLGPRSSFGGFQSGPAFFDDPFERFERLEREMGRREMEMNGFTAFNANPMASPFTFMGGPGAGGFLGSTSSFGMLPEPPRRGSGGRGGGKWMSESYMTQCINGVTQTTHKRRDWEVCCCSSLQ
jgi:DnaJ family protein B protein 6